jgi:hypothetical protein
MNDARIRVLLTGATGNWGRAALRADQYREQAERNPLLAQLVDA